LEVDQEDLARAVKTTTGATKKRSKKDRDSDSEDSDFDEMPKKIKVPKRFDPLVQDHKIINHVDRFEDLLSQWPKARTDFSVFIQWTKKMEKLCCAHEIGQKLYLKFKLEQDAILVGTATVKTDLELVKTLLIPFPEVRTLLKKLLLLWSGNSHVMKKILLMGRENCAHYQIEQVMENKIREEEKAHGIVIPANLSKDARKKVISALNNQGQQRNNQNQNRSQNRGQQRSRK